MITAVPSSVIEVTLTVSTLSSARFEHDATASGCFLLRLPEIKQSKHLSSFCDHHFSVAVTPQSTLATSITWHGT